MNLMMMKRLVDGDTEFGWRVEAAAWVREVDYTTELLRFVAADEDVQNAVSLDEHLTISSTDVPDETILNAVNRYIAKG